MTDPTPLTPVRDILHENDVRAVIRDELNEKAPRKGTTVIANPTAPGATYVQAEAASTRDAVVSILTALRNSGIIA